jgi:hypothetical protein
MSPRIDLSRQAAKARKALAYSIAQAADVKGAKADRRAARIERVGRRQYVEAMRLADLEGGW